MQYAETRKLAAEKVDDVEGIEIHGKIDTGLSVKQGEKNLQIALVDEDGNIVGVGDKVAKRLFTAACKTYEDFWLGNGTLRTISP